MKLTISRSIVVVPLGLPLDGVLFSDRQICWEYLGTSSVWWSDLLIGRRMTARRRVVHVYTACYKLLFDGWSHARWAWWTEFLADRRWETVCMSQCWLIAAHKPVYRRGKGMDELNTKSEKIMVWTSPNRQVTLATPIIVAWRFIMFQSFDHLKW